MDWIDVIGYGSAIVAFLFFILIGVAIGIFLMATLIKGCLKLW